MLVLRTVAEPEDSKDSSTENLTSSAERLVLCGRDGLTRSLTAGLTQHLNLAAFLARRPLHADDFVTTFVRHHSEAALGNKTSQTLQSLGRSK